MPLFAARPARASDPRRTGASLYRQAVAQARQPGFYLHCGVADSVDGRFDMIVLHVALLMHRLRGEPAPAGVVARALAEEFVADMDRSLREMGVGDLGVPRRVKAMARAYNGRLHAYDAALGQDGEALADALRRNVYRGNPPAPALVDALVDYVRQQCRVLAAQPWSELGAGTAIFTEPPAEGVT
jgi:cytochrome b pre-mRNA-processing protein 3